VTTKEGTPGSRRRSPGRRRSRRRRAQRARSRRGPETGGCCPELKLGDGHAGEAADVPDGEVDLAEEQHEDDAERDDRHAGICTIRLLKFVAPTKFEFFE